MALPTEIILMGQIEVLDLRFTIDLFLKICHALRSEDTLFCVKQGLFTLERLDIMIST